MDKAILKMLEEYNCQSTSDYENALKEIMQEIALLGLWRAKFYEHALFYGGSALRILHGLPRFSEDLDFSLLTPNPNLDLAKFYNAIITELEGFGFIAELTQKNKSVESQIDSAFIKADTKINFLRIKVPESILQRVHGNQSLKIKVEVDLLPPGHHGTEVQDIYRPIPFQVKTMPLSDLFAGKMHAILARKWQTRVKGRDYYDYLWYLGKQSPLNLKHLEARLLQTGHITESLTLDTFQAMLAHNFSNINIPQAKQDVAPFLAVREKASLDLWSNEYFIRSIDKIACAGN